MAQTPLTIKKLTCALLAASVAAVIFAASTGLARAGDDDDDEDVPYDTKVFRSIMGTMGLRRDGDVGIDYRERSPLVVPPSLNLPPPEAAPATPNAANWPVDQDVKRQKEAKAARKKAALTHASVEDESRVLSQKELTPGATGTPKRAAPQGRDDSKPKGEAGDRLSVFDLGYKGDFFSVKSLFGSKDEGESAKFEKEPARASLTEPPVGYRTPSPAQPYGLTPEAKRSKPMDLSDRQTPEEVRR